MAGYTFHRVSWAQLCILWIIVTQARFAESDIIRSFDDSTLSLPSLAHLDSSKANSLELVDSKSVKHFEIIPQRQDFSPSSVNNLKPEQLADQPTPRHSIDSEKPPNALAEECVGNFESMKLSSISRRSFRLMPRGLTRRKECRGTKPWKGFRHQVRRLKRTIILWIVELLARAKVYGMRSYLWSIKLRRFFGGKCKSSFQLAFKQKYRDWLITRMNQGWVPCRWYRRWVSGRNPSRWTHSSFSIPFGSVTFHYHVIREYLKTKVEILLFIWTDIHHSQRI